MGQRPLTEKSLPGLTGISNVLTPWFRFDSSIDENAELEQLEREFISEMKHCENYGEKLLPAGTFGADDNAEGIAQEDIESSSSDDDDEIIVDSIMLVGHHEGRAVTNLGPSLTLQDILESESDDQEPHILLREYDDEESSDDSGAMPLGHSSTHNSTLSTEQAISPRNN